MTERGMNSALIHAIVLAACVLPYFINLGTPSIWDANEAFYAETPREMLVTGDYLAPQFNYEPRAQKPPLTYWVILLFYRLFGVSEFAVRLPSALAAAGTMLFSYGLARILFTPAAALGAAVITATTARVFILARRLPIDILLIFFLTGTLFFLVRALQKKGRVSWAAVYVCAALGFMTKGPVAVVIPALAYAGWMLWRRRFHIAEAYPFMGAALFLVIVLPWYVYIYSVHGWTYISPFFLRDNLGRFATVTLGPARGPLYYFPVFATDFFPWSILALPVLYFLWSRRNTENPLESLRFGLPLFWCAVVFVLFSFSKNKQEYYIASMYPVAAVLLAGVLTGETGTGLVSKPGRLWTAVYGTLSALLALLAVAAPYFLNAYMPGTSALLRYGPAFLFAAAAALVFWSGAVGGKTLRGFPVLAASLGVVYLAAALFYIPALEPFRPVNRFCRVITARWSEGDEAGFYGTALPSMVYYLRRPIFQEHDPERMLRRFRSERRVFCILSRKDYEYFSGRNLTIHILDRHSLFALRLGSVLNSGASSGEELLLVSNRPHSETRSAGSSPES